MKILDGYLSRLVSLVLWKLNSFGFVPAYVRLLISVVFTANSIYVTYLVYTMPEIKNVIMVLTILYVILGCLLIWSRFSLFLQAWSGKDVEVDSGMMLPANQKEIDERIESLFVGIVLSSILFIKFPLPFGGVLVLWLFSVYFNSCGVYKAEEKQ